MVNYTERKGVARMILHICLNIYTSFVRLGYFSSNFNVIQLNVSLFAVRLTFFKCNLQINFGTLKYIDAKLIYDVMLQI